jgi:hypothetical protein
VIEPESQVAFRDLPADCYPFTVRARRESDGEIVWSRRVTGPCALQVPPLSAEHGPVYIQIYYADGDMVDSRDHDDG